MSTSTPETPASPDFASMLSAIVKSYDVRGLVGSQITAEIVEALAAAFVDEVGASGSSVAVGHDMRDSSPIFADAFARGATARGADVLALGLCSTDQTYFVSGSRQVAACMFTASHNPAAYNGMKLSRPGAEALSLETGLANIRDTALGYLENGIPSADRTGSVTTIDTLPEYASYLRSLVDLRGERPLKVVVDAGNGMGGMTVPAVLGTAEGLEDLGLEIIPMYFELDGTFPNHEANPLDPKNLVDLQAAVREHGADIGLAFDGDADRCFVVDENGEPVSPSAVAAIVATREIASAAASGDVDGVTIIHNLITSRAFPEAVEALGAATVRTRVGHSIIKAEMKRTGAIFGGEHSAHYYFKNFWGADNGMLAAMHVLAEWRAGDKTMSQLGDEFTPYVASGEINSTVSDAAAATARVEAAFDGRGAFDRLDGLTIDGPSENGSFWWVSVRSSNTEPLLRLNVEAHDEPTMSAIRDEVLALIRA